MTETTWGTTADANLSEGATRQLALHSATLSYKVLPPDLLELTKQCVLDTLGVVIGASGLAPKAKVIADYVNDMGGRAESTILGLGDKAPAPWAAFANGSFGHMLDYDDVAPGGHPSITTIPVAFAMSEKLGGVSGRDFLTAVAVAEDVIVRLGRSVTIPQWTTSEGWFATQLFGFLSGAAAAGRLLGLDSEQMENALGIAFNQLSGSRQMVVAEATDVRAMQAGFTGQGGIMSAQLAQRGITGPKEFLEGRYGLYKTYVRCEPDWQAAVGGLGTYFPMLDTHAFKVWPACAATRMPNAATLELRESYNLDPQDVNEVLVVGGDMYTQLLSEPIESKRCPQTSIDAKYSIPFTVAVMLAKGNVTLGAFTDAGLNDPEVLRMAQRVRYQAVPEDEKTSLIPAIEIRTRNGGVYKTRVDSVPGDAKNPVTWRHIEAKFRDCVSFAPRPIATANIDRVIERVRDLENVSDVVEIIQLLS